MNELERLLADDVARLMDRLAASIPEGAVGRIRASMPAVAPRIDDVEQRLAAARTALLEDYARWRQALEDAENIWAVAAWRTAVEAEPVIGVIRAAA
jgi:hypothetical protein